MTIDPVTLVTPDWPDYDLLDTGNGRKLERFGLHTLIRPEPLATWQPALPLSVWQEADAEFRQHGKQGGVWAYRRPMESSWLINYKHLRFRVRAADSRQVGVFPENASHWDWISGQIAAANKPVHVLNLFGYTGLATLAAARAGAHVTHVDASKKAVTWARDNQALSGLADRPIRWIVDDAFAYIRREERRGVRYDGLILDPPAFGRGPDGEVWTLATLFPALCLTCRAVLSSSPLFVVITVYTRDVGLESLRDLASTIIPGGEGVSTVGYLATRERSKRRTLVHSLFARWTPPTKTVQSSGTEPSSSIG
jgi:23S rRNA (cytosine1962-C5)-methyltransferase